MVGPGFRLDGGNTPILSAEERTAKRKRRNRIATTLGLFLGMAGAAIIAIRYASVNDGTDKSIQNQKEENAIVRAETPAVPGTNIEGIIRTTKQNSVGVEGPKPLTPDEIIINLYKDARKTGAETASAIKYHNNIADVVLNNFGMIKNTVARQVSDDGCYLSGKYYERAGNKTEALRRYVAAVAVSLYPDKDYAKKAMSDILMLTKKGMTKEMLAAIDQSPEIKQKFIDVLAYQLADKFIGSIHRYWVTFQGYASMGESHNAKLPRVYTEDGLPEERLLRSLTSKEGLENAMARNTQQYMVDRGLYPIKITGYDGSVKHNTHTELEQTESTIKSELKKGIPHTGARAISYSQFLQKN